LKLSIVIPTLNEVDFLGNTIAHMLKVAHSPENFEILVIDAGSTDQTLESIEAYSCKAYSKPEFVLQKYQSLNLGLAESTADSVLFLDADTLLPHHFDQLIQTELRDSNVVGGAFEFDFQTKNFILSIIVLVNQIRYRIEKSYYGDQAVFCRRKVALKMGGYPEKSLMESAYFCRKLREQGKLRLINKSVKTSARRFIEHGILKVLWFDFRMWIRFLLRMDVQKFGGKYWKQEH